MKIYVATKEQKQKLLSESKYIHDFIETVRTRGEYGQMKTKVVSLNSNRCNTLMHIHLNPDMVIVQSEV